MVGAFIGPEASGLLKETVGYGYMNLALGRASYPILIQPVLQSALADINSSDKNSAPLHRHGNHGVQVDWATEK